MNRILRMNCSMLLLYLLLAGTAKAAGKPDIVVLYADDLGYGDVQCYNPERGKIPTPNIDRLATDGMRFTDGQRPIAHPSRTLTSPPSLSVI